MAGLPPPGVGEASAVVIELRAVCWYGSRPWLVVLIMVLVGIIEVVEGVGWAC